MTSTATPSRITNYAAGSDLSSSQYKAVVLSSDGAVDVAGANAAAIGFVYNKPTAGKSAEIATMGGGAKAIAGGTISAGDPLATDANGDLVIATSGDYIVATAAESAVDNDVFAVFVGNASPTNALVEELTVTGAVSARVQSVELNHATVIVAATIADAADHQGFLIVKNTSASGTAAHTLTLTSGTFDGTNNVATLNAPNEALAVYIDSAGNGTIIENVGTVALS